MYRISGYRSRSGKVPVFDLIRELELSTQARVARIINYLKVCGYNAKMPHVRVLETNLYELRVRGRQEVRIFYTIIQERIILLHGFIKKTSRIPDKELFIARTRLKEISI